MNKYRHTNRPRDGVLADDECTLPTGDLWSLMGYDLKRTGHFFPKVIPLR